MSGEDIVYNIGQGLAAGPTQGFGAAFGKSIEGTPWASGPVDVATGSRTLQTLNGAVKLGSILGEGAGLTYFGSLLGCQIGVIH